TWATSPVASASSACWPGMTRKPRTAAMAPARRTTAATARGLALAMRRIRSKREVLAFIPCMCVHRARSPPHLHGVHRHAPATVSGTCRLPGCSVGWSGLDGLGRARRQVGLELVDVEGDVVALG